MKPKIPSLAVMIGCLMFLATNVAMGQNPMTGGPAPGSFDYVGGANCTDPGCTNAPLYDDGCDEPCVGGVAGSYSVDLTGLPVPICGTIEMEVCRRGDFGNVSEFLNVNVGNLTAVAQIPGIGGFAGDCDPTLSCTIVQLDPCDFIAQADFSLTGDACTGAPLNPAACIGALSTCCFANDANFNNLIDATEMIGGPASVNLTLAGAAFAFNPVNCFCVLPGCANPNEVLINYIAYDTSQDPEIFAPLTACASDDVLNITIEATCLAEYDAAGFDASFTANPPQGFMDSGNGTATLDPSMVTGVTAAGKDVVLTLETPCGTVMHTIKIFPGGGGVELNCPESLCTADDPFMLAATDADDNPVDGTFTINGMASTGMFDPSALGAGTYSIVFTSAPDPPGCATTCQIVVNATPEPPVLEFEPLCFGGDLIDGYGIFAIRWYILLVHRRDNGSSRCCGRDDD